MSIDFSSKLKAQSSKLKEPRSEFLRKLRGSSGSIGSPLRVILTVLAIFILSQYLAAIIVAFYARLAHPAINISWYINHSVDAQFFFILLAESLAIGLVWWVLTRRRVDWRSIGFSRWPHWRDIKWATAGFVAFYALSIIVSLIISLIWPNLNIDQNQNVGFSTLVGPQAWILAFIGLVILPPLGEETLVRGYLYTGLRSKMKFLPALLITSVMFGAAHFQTDNGQLIWAVALDTFMLSLVLVYLREKTGVLYAGIMVHLLNNLVAFLVHFHV